MRDPLIILEHKVLSSRHGRILTVAIAASVLFHALFLFYHVAHRPVKLKPLVHLGGPLSVELAPLSPVSKTLQPSKASQPSPKHRAARRRVIAVKKASPEASSPAPRMSFLDYVNRARKRRDAAQDEYPVAPLPVGPFPDQGVHPQGTSGIFRIIRMNEDEAEISFLGWHSEFSNAHRQVFEVEAGPDGSIRLAIVRKMISIIRQYYQGDFNWESDRLGGEVVLSARLKDNAELEAFLMKEFFGP